MGARNVRAALLAAKVPGSAVRVLVAMALVALDSPQGDREARVYFAGRAVLATLVGYPLGDDAGLRYVDRALRQLIAAGYVERLTKPMPGRAVRYRLHLPACGQPVDKGPPTGG